MVEALPFIRQPDRVARKARDVSAADWRYQTHMRNTIFFHVCGSAILRAENPCITS